MHRGGFPGEGKDLPPGPGYRQTAHPAIRFTPQPAARGETLEDLAERFGYQFAGNLQKWVGKWNDLAVDQHLLIALSAPRPVFVSGGVKDQWGDPRGQFLALVAAGPVYRLLGAKGLGVTEMPALDRPVADGGVGYHYHSRGHAVLPADWKTFLDFAARHYKAAPKKQPARGPSR